MEAINVKCVIIYSIFISNIPTSVFKLLTLKTKIYLIKKSWGNHVSSLPI